MILFIVIANLQRLPLCFIYFRIVIEVINIKISNATLSYKEKAKKCK